MATKKTGTVELTIPKMELHTMRIRLVGDSPLVVHAWAEKAKKQMQDKQAGTPSKGKEKRDPKADFLGSLYCMNGQVPKAVTKGDKTRATGTTFGFPAIAFKKAAVDACSFVDGVTKVSARGAFHVVGEMVELEYDAKALPVMRQDMVRIGMGTADLRYRPEFTEWAAEITVRYNKYALTPEQIVQIFNIAGFSIGVGEQRPQKNGAWGMFHVAGKDE